METGPKKAGERSPRDRSPATRIEEPSFRLRPDLQRSIDAGASGALTLADPLASRYFRFAGVERDLIELLRQPLTLGEIRERARRLPGLERIDGDEVGGFVAKLIRDGLLLVEAFGHGRRRIEHRRRTAVASWIVRGLGILSIRIPGPDPTPLLRPLEPVASLFFAPLTIFLVLVLSLTVAVGAVIRGDEIAARMPSIESFLQLDSLMALSVTIAVMKVLHELGHATACRRFGGECRDAGLLLLVFLPCLYVDVSSSWLFPDRRRRLLVAAAGILVELAIASIAALLWYATEPGLFNSICFRIAFVGSVGTLMVNANPLMRFDGYFILTDLLDRPNLGRQANRALTDPLVSLCERRATPSLRAWFEHPLLAGFGAASFAYRIAVVGAIAWGLARSLHQAGLDAVAWLLLAVMAIGLLLPTIGSTRSIVGGVRRGRLSGPRTGLVAAAIVAASVLVARYEIAWPVRVPVMLEFGQAMPLHAPASGRFEPLRRLGDRVAMGEPLGSVESEELERELLELDGEIAIRQLAIELLEKRHVSDPQAAAMLPTERSRLDELVERRALLEQRRIDRTIVAPRDGVLTVAALRPNREPSETRLDDRTGSVWDPENAGCGVSAGEELGWIGDATRPEVICYVPERLVEEFRIGSTVRLRLHPYPGTTFDGNVTSIEQIDTADLPSNLVAAGIAAADRRTDATGTELVPIEVTFRVRVEPLGIPPGATHGALGYLKLELRKRSIAEHLLRGWRDAVRFRF